MWLVKGKKLRKYTDPVEAYRAAQPGEVITGPAGQFVRQSNGWSRL
jgi:hypothetical protein